MILLTWEWQTVWRDSLGVGELLILAWRDPAGELVGIAPLYYANDGGTTTLYLARCTEVADYLDIIVRQDCEPEIFAGFLHYLTSEQAVSWEQINLCNLYETSLTYQRLPELAHQIGLRVEAEQGDEVYKYRFGAGDTKVMRAQF